MLLGTEGSMRLAKAELRAQLLDPESGHPARHHKPWRISFWDTNGESILTTTALGPSGHLQSDLGS